MSTLKEFKFFSIIEYDQEAEYLRSMHRKGWKVVKISFPGFYTFESCEPEDVVYQLDYNQEGISHKAEYIQMFADCGWEHLFDFVGYSYFRKPAAEMSSDESIFCDDASRLAMLERIYKGRLIPLLILFCLIVLPQLVLQMFHLNNPIRLGLFVLYLVITILYLSIFLYFGINYYRMAKKVSGQ